MNGVRADFIFVIIIIIEFEKDTLYMATSTGVNMRYNCYDTIIISIHHSIALAFINAKSKTYCGGFQSLRFIQYKVIVGLIFNDAAYLRFDFIFMKAQLNVDHE